MRDEAGFRLQLIGALARDLPPDATLLGVGLPGQDVLRMLGALRPDLQRIEALSEMLLVHHAGFAAALLAPRLPDSLDADPEPPLVVGRQEAEGRVGPARRMGGLPLIGPGTALRIRALPGVLAQLRRPGLLHLGAEPGHETLLAAALPMLATRGTPVWIDLPAASAGAGAAAAMLSALPQMRGFALFGLGAGGGLVRLPQERHPPLRGLLLVPRVDWLPYGLERLADEPGAEETGFRAPLLVPRSAGFAVRLLDRILPGYDAPQRPAPPLKSLLRPGQALFAEGARLDPGAGEGPLLRATGQAEIRLLALPPAAGTFRLTLLLSAPPGTPPPPLTLRLQGLALPLSLPAGPPPVCGPSGCPLQTAPPPGAAALPEVPPPPADLPLRAGLRLVLADPAEPLILSLRGLPVAGPAIRGLGLDLLEPFGSDIHLSDRRSGQRRGEDSHAGGDDDGSGDGRPLERVAEGRSVWRPFDRRRAAAP